VENTPTSLPQSAGLSTDAATLALLHDLTPVVEANLNRHLSMAKPWMPHEYVPWSRGRDFDELPWEPGQSILSDIAQIAFEVNLLTEDNLPSYHRAIGTLTPARSPDDPWRHWLNRWTAEEGRHSIVMRDYLMVTRGIDPDHLETERMYQVEHGYDPGHDDPIRGLAYVAFQELATRISHRNTGRYTQDPIADRLLARVAADENLHMIFYRDLIKNALEINPNRTVPAIAAEVLNFQMPGTGIRDFLPKALQIAKAGIYDLRIHHDDVVMPTLRAWGFFDLEGLDGDAEKARTRVAEHLERTDRSATRFTERRTAAAAKAAARAEEGTAQPSTS
jgi:acyl-[acyl-carrier-protein] desaturase